MKRTPPELINKEKAIFVLLALLCSAGIYSFFASQPATLQPQQPLASISSPAGVRVAVNTATGIERDYLRGKRKNPFNDPHRNDPRPAIEPTEETGGGIKVPVAPKDHDPIASQERIKQPFNPRDAGLEYIGVVMLDEKACALLRTRDSSAPQRVAIGERVAGLDCRVTKIDLQGVWLTDGASTSVLRNERFISPALKVPPAKKDSRPSVFF